MDNDPEAAAITRQRLLDMVATDKTPIIGFHMPFQAIGRVEKAGKGYTCRPALYQYNI